MAMSTTAGWLDADDDLDPDTVKVPENPDVQPDSKTASSSARFQASNSHGQVVRCGDVLKANRIRPT
jgi:hypothetical protein